MFLDQKLHPANPEQFQIKRREKGKTCITTMSLSGKNANVRDSCILPEDEASTTCAIMGSYTK